PRRAAAADPPGPPVRTPAPPLSQLAAPTDRGHHLEPEASARPGTARWTCPRRPVRPGRPPTWLRQRIEASSWTLKRQPGLEQHGGRVPAGLWVRIVQRLLALNTAIWHNWTIGAPVKRSLIAYDH